MKKHLLSITIIISINVGLNAQVTLDSEGKPLKTQSDILRLKGKSGQATLCPSPTPRLTLKSLTIKNGDNLASTIEGVSDDEHWDKDEFIGYIIYNIGKYPAQGLYKWNGNRWKRLVVDAKKSEAKRR